MCTAMWTAPPVSISPYSPACCMHTWVVAGTSVFIQQSFLCTLASQALQYMLAASALHQQPPQPEFPLPPPSPTKQQRKSLSQSQPLCAVERQLARRLSCLLMRGAAARHPMEGPQRSLLQPQPPALQQQENHSEEVQAAVVGGGHTSWLSTKAGSDISSSSRPVGVVLAPRPAVVIRRRASVERIFRLPAPSPDVSLDV